MRRQIPRNNDVEPSLRSQLTSATGQAGEKQHILIPRYCDEDDCEDFDNDDDGDENGFDDDGD